MAQSRQETTAVAKRDETGSAVSKKQKSPLANLSDFLEGRRGEISKILPPNLSVERVIKTAIMAAMENEDIGKRCTPLSIYRSVVQASLMGLIVGSGYNEGYFIRYGTSCTFRASYLGWAKVAVRSEGIDVIRASIVYSNDDLDMTEQPPSVTHKPQWLGGGRGAVVGALACAYTLRELPDGRTVHALYDFSFVPPEDLDAARKMADKGKPSPAWRSWPNEMRKKVAIRRLCKLLPRNDELSRLTRIENNADQGVVDVPDPDIDNVNQMVVDSRFEKEEPRKLESPKEAALEGEVVDAEFKEPSSKPDPAKAEKKQSRTAQLKGQVGDAQATTEKAPAPEAPDYGPPEDDKDLDF